MTDQVTVLNFDHVYERQSFYRTVTYDWLDFLDVQGVNGYCHPEAQAIISRRLKRRKFRGISFIGSGNYHYVTHLLIKELRTPFSLVLFDSHTDMMPAPDELLLSCGSWALNALTQLEQLKFMVIIGVVHEQQEFVPPYLVDKLFIVPSHQLTGHQSIVDRMAAAIPTEHIYISIDKDVLNKKDAVTNWEQGEMTLKQLLDLIERIGERKVVCGLDVCGEYPVSWADNFTQKNRLAIVKNDHANAQILSLAQKLIKRKAYLTAG